MPHTGEDACEYHRAHEADAVILACMKKQHPLDLSLLVTGIVLGVASLTPWINIGFISVNGTATWWGYTTLVGALSVVAFASTRLWPQMLDESIAKYLKNIALAGSIVAIVVLAYVGIRLTDASRQFNDSMNENTSEVTDLSGLGQEFEDSLNEFANSIAKAFQPSLALGWYASSVASVGSLILVVKKRGEEEVAETHVFDPPSL